MPSRRFLLFFAAVAALAPRPARAEQINPLVGVNFQPYIGAWSGNPLQPPFFNSYSYQDVLGDLEVVKSAGFQSIKTFGVGTSPFSGNGNNLDSNQFNVKAANALGLSVYLGANLQFANGALDVTRTRMEIDLAIQQAKAYPGTVKALIVGNENIGKSGMTVADTVALLNYAKSARTAAGFDSTTLPVTTVQQWGVLADSANQALSQAAEGTIYANIYPFFDKNTPITSAVTQFNADLAALRSALDGFGLQNLKIAVGETGWATAGTNTVNTLGIPSFANANKYFDDYMAQVSLPTFFFEAFDEPWKANPQTDPQSVEPHFGVLKRFHVAGSLPPVVHAPEPSALVLALTGAICCVAWRRAQRRI